MYSEAACIYVTVSILGRTAPGTGDLLAWSLNFTPWHYAFEAHLKVAELGNLLPT